METGSTRDAGTDAASPPEAPRRSGRWWRVSLGVVGALATLGSLLLPWADAEVAVETDAADILGHSAEPISATIEVGRLRGLELDGVWAIAGLAGVVLVAAVLGLLRPIGSRTHSLFLILGGAAVTAAGVLGVLAPDILVEREIDAAAQEISEGRHGSLDDMGAALAPSLGVSRLSAEVMARPLLGSFVPAGGGVLVLVGGVLLLVHGQGRDVEGSEG